MAWLPLILLTVIAAIAVAAGLSAFDHRDVT
jgi:hypothetical protein